MPDFTDYYRAMEDLRRINTEKGGLPIPWTGVRKRRKRHGRGKGNMMAVRCYEVAPSRYCCYGHDHIEPNKGSQRRTERRAWVREWQDEQWSELLELMAYESWE